MSVKWHFEDPDKIAKKLLAEAAGRYKRARCPVHGKTPENVRVRGNDIEAEFCCERLKEAANRAYAGA